MAHARTIRAVKLPNNYYNKNINILTYFRNFFLNLSLLFSKFLKTF